MSFRLISVIVQVGGPPPSKYRDEDRIGILTLACLKGHNKEYSSVLILLSSVPRAGILNAGEGRFICETNH